MHDPMRLTHVSFSVSLDAFEVPREPPAGRFSILYQMIRQCYRKFPRSCVYARKLHWRTQKAPGLQSRGLSWNLLWRPSLRIAQANRLVSVLRRVQRRGVTVEVAHVERGDPALGVEASAVVLGILAVAVAIVIHSARRGIVFRDRR